MKVGYITTNKEVPHVATVTLTDVDEESMKVMRHSKETGAECSVVPGVPWTLAEMTRIMKEDDDAQTPS